MTGGARQRWLSEWLMEFSVLWAVFPFLDQLIERRRGVDWVVVVWGWTIALTTAILGLLLHEDKTP